MATSIAVQPAGRSWFERYLRAFRGHRIAACLALPLGVYTIGAGIALATGFHDEYVTAEPIYLGLLGMVWTTAFLLWAAGRIPKIVIEIRDVFLDAEAYDAETNRWFGLLFGSWLHIAFAAPFIVALWVNTALAIDRGELPWFEPVWSLQDNALAANLIIDLYTVPIVLLTVTTGLGIILFVVLVARMSRLRLLPVPEVTRACLRPIITFGIVTGLGWSFGVSLIVLFLQPSLDTASVTIVVVLAVLGALMVFGPQFAVHLGLARARSDIINKLTHRFLERYPLATFESTRVAVDAAQSSHVEELRVAASARTWIYEPRDVLWLAVNGLLPIASFSVSLAI